MLSKLLKPKKICVVGANEKAGFGGDTSRNVIRYMPEGSYYFVNPSRKEVFGKPCYPSLSALPENIDLVVLCTPQHTVEGLLQQASAKGAGGAVVFASGYAETGTPQGLASQQALQQAAAQTGMAVMGPNCAGFVNYVDKVYPFAFLSEDRERSGSVGFVSQSGQLCLSLMDNPNTRFSYIISAGNCDVVQMEDYLEFLVNDPDTKVVAAYLEGIKNPAKLVQLLKTAALNRKPVVVLKAGRSEKGRQLAASHTGSLAGADRFVDALFEKFGVIRVNDLEELLYTAQLFAVLPKLPQKATFASMNLSGGETGICADMGALEGIEYPDFTQETLAELQGMLPSYASPANPLDMTATLSYDTEKYAEALRCVMRDEGIGMVVVGYTLLEEIADPAIEYMAPAMEQAVRGPGAKPLALMPFVGNTRNPEYATRLEAAGIALLPPPLYAFKVLRHLANFICYKADDHNLEVSIPAPGGCQERVAHGEYESGLMAARFGLPCGGGRVASSEEQAAAIANQLGYPLVMKIESADILHKSDVGGVQLNVKDAAQARRCYSTLLENAKRHCPDAVVNGVLVQPMRPAGTEMIIGVSVDESFGPAVMVGLGGIFVEVFRDTAMCLVPVSRPEALHMVQSLQSAQLLRGYRGSPPLDTDAFVDAVLAVSNMAAAYKDTLLEADFNPVFLYEKGVYAADAVVVTRGCHNDK